MRCRFCGTELGDGDPYNLLSAHIHSCQSEEARRFRKARDEEAI